jgi:mono/diheme cytochrome c family protein
MRYRSWLLIAACFVGAGPVHAADYLTMSGKQLYWRFCAACHGEQGKGDGPVATMFTAGVSDLTQVARRKGDSFTREYLVQIIDGRSAIGAHGSRTMPVWGEDFRRAYDGHPDAERATRVVIERLADYIWSLQQPALTR